MDSALAQRGSLGASRAQASSQLPGRVKAFVGVFGHTRSQRVGPLYPEFVVNPLLNPSQASETEEMNSPMLALAQERLSLSDSVRVSLSDYVTVGLSGSFASLGTLNWSTELLIVSSNLGHGEAPSVEAGLRGELDAYLPSISPIPTKPPYASLIRTLIQEDRIVGARKLLATALQEGGATPEILKLQTILGIPRVRRTQRTDTDRSREYDWLTQHASDYRGKWVALNGNDVLAHGTSLKELRAKLAALAPDRPPLIHYVS